MMMELTEQHRWLERLAGEWSAVSECSMGPGQPPMKSEMQETARMNGAWLICEGRGSTPDGGTMSSLLQLGYDPAKGKFVGTFTASVMTHLWVYEGTLDAAGKVLTLDTVGPIFGGPEFGEPGAMANYQDIFEITDANHRVLRSQMQAKDGQWHPFMAAHYTRKA